MKESPAVQTANGNYKVLYEETNERSTTFTPEEEKGRLFENWVTSKFAKQYFILKEWRSDKFHQGMFAESNKWPDLVFNMITASHNVEFAVECKWRSLFKNNRIEWARNDQITNYREYQKLSGNPVFVVLGVGASPSNPEKVYIVPLKDISSKYLTLDFLNSYQMNHSYNFFYDADSKVLR
jgi:hypothetical protein